MERIQQKKNLKEIGKEFKQKINEQKTATEMMNVFLEYEQKLNEEHMSHTENTYRQLIYTSKAMKKYVDECVISAPGYELWLETENEDSVQRKKHLSLVLFGL